MAFDLERTWRIRGRFQDYLVMRGLTRESMSESARVPPALILGELDASYSSPFGRRICNELYEAVTGSSPDSLSLCRPHRDHTRLMSRITEAFRSGELVAIRLSRGNAMALSIVIGSGGAASFSAEIEGGGTLTATGSVTQLHPGEYQVRASGATMVITTSDGLEVPRTTRFDVHWNARNAALIRALRGVTSPIPLHVQSTPVPDAPGQEQTRTPTPGSEEAQRQELEALPERIRNFLFTPEGPNPRPQDYAALLRIARSIEDLSDAELAGYRARTVGGTLDVADFEASVNRWLAELRAHRGAERGQDVATQALFGLDAIYEMYRSWQRGLSMSAPPSWIAEWEALPVSALPTDREGVLNQLYLRMRRSLAAYGYASLAAFTTAIQRFLNAFRENAYYIGLELLDRYEHLLVQESGHYQGDATTLLYTSLAPARVTFQQADVHAAAARQQFGGWSPGDVSNFHAAGVEHQRRIAQGRAQVAAQASQHPLLANQDFPLEELGRADQLGVERILRSYILSGLEHVRSTRARLRADHEIIFRLGVLVTHAKARQGIGPGSIWEKIIDDHLAPTVDQIGLDLMTGVLAVAAGLMSGGSALAAAASLGLSSYLALQQYEDYAFRVDTYGAQLLLEEPSLAWVVLAIVGVVADFGAVSRVIRPIRQALRNFQRTGDIAELEVRLSSVEERIRQSILSRAQLEAQAQRGWEGVAPRGALRMSLFGLDLAAELLGKAVYSVQLNLRRGINTFNRWVLTREAIDLFGDINRLSPEQLQQVSALYRQAIDALQRIATHGRSLGMTAEEVEAVLQNWARRGFGTTDDVMREMTASRGTRTGPGGAMAADAIPLGRAERLQIFYQRLRAAPRPSDAEAALRQIRTTLDEVEDLHSGIPRADPPPPPGMSDGRMYPPLDDFVTRSPDGSITARTRAHTIQIGRNGDVQITNRQTGAVEYERR